MCELGINIYTKEEFAKKESDKMDDLNNQESKNGKCNSQEKSLTNKFIEKFIVIIKEKIVELLITIIITVLTSVFSIFVSVKFIIPNDISSVNRRVDNAEKDLNKISDKISDSFNDLSKKLEDNEKEFKEEIREAKKDIREENNSFKDGITAMLSIISVKTTAFSASKLNCSTMDLEAGYSSGPSLSANWIIGKDFKSGKKYKTKNLINKKILVPYTENGQEVYFLGQYNENYHWDGNCTINVYKKNKLLLITNANYDDGKLKDYRQVLEGPNNTWIVSNRKAHKNYNSGESWSYRKNNEITKKFSLKKVKISDIISVEKFKSQYAKDLDGYYNGRTSNGKYNDDTGRAYLVKYFKDGIYVRTLYRGCFNGGMFEDYTGKAWYIVKDTNTDYMYYKGPFEKNTAKYKDDKFFTNHLKRKDIEEIIKGYNFSCDLKWDLQEEA